MAPMRQSRPDAGLGFQAMVLKTFQVVPSLLGRGVGRCSLVTALESDSLKIRFLSRTRLSWAKNSSDGEHLGDPLGEPAERDSSCVGRENLC